MEVLNFEKKVKDLLGKKVRILNFDHFDSLKIFKKIQNLIKVIFEIVGEFPNSWRIPKKFTRFMLKSLALV